ncbi:MAG TPA: pentapeptide repeat-containing protein [Ktedonobacteraceae bacterium]|nr:pentapeptide repeat-containing protein [Ktedonobacteraceae bacterium]
MGNRQQLSILKQGSLAWNEWRKKHPDVQPDLSEANFAGANLRGANLRGANLEGADMVEADLQEANLLGAKVVEANLHHANLHKADLGFADLTFASLSEANLTTARLWKADLTAATLSGANLTGANLTMTMLRETDFTDAILAEAILDYAILVETNLRRANVTGCSVCGLSAWNIHLDEAHQADLVISSPNEPAIIVDTLEVAQFLYLFLHNKQLHQVITSIASNMVLILGRFTAERKPFLEAMRDELRVRGYTPLLFNFEMPLSHDFSASLRTLARLARFIIADLSRHKSISQELRSLLSDTTVPVQPLLNGSRKLYQMFPDFKHYPCVLPGYRYSSLAELQTTFEEKVIKPAEEKVKALACQLSPADSIGASSQPSKKTPISVDR